jgi:hypothetical protein
VCIILLAACAHRRPEPFFLGLPHDLPGKPGPLCPDGKGDVIQMPTVSAVQIAPAGHYEASKSKGNILLEQTIDGIHYYATEEMQTLTIDGITVRYLMTRRWKMPL